MLSAETFRGHAVGSSMTSARRRISSYIPANVKSVTLCSPIRDQLHVPSADNWSQNGCNGGLNTQTFQPSIQWRRVFAARSKGERFVVPPLQLITPILSAVNEFKKNIINIYLTLTMQTPTFQIFAPRMPPGRPPSLAPAATTLITPRRAGLLMSFLRQLCSA